MAAFIFVDEARLFELGAYAARKYSPDAAMRCTAVSRSAVRRLKTLHGMLEALNRNSRGEPVKDRADEWLTDNGYLIERIGRSAAAAVADGGELASRGGELCLEKLCYALVRFGGGIADEKRISAFFAGVQSVRPLSEEELGLLIPVMELSVIRYILRLTNTEESDGKASCMGNAVGSLKYLSESDLHGMLEKLSRIEQILLLDPTGDYPRMTDESRACYRAALARVAKERGISEQTAAERALALAAESSEHIGKYIFQKPLGDAAKKTYPMLYILAVCLPTVLIAAGFALLFKSLPYALLMLLPVTEICKNLIDRIASERPPRPVLRMELENGVPDEGRTLCVIVSIAESGAAASLLRKLEEYSITNRDRNISFGLLLDCARSKDGTGSADCIDEFLQGINGLNDKYDTDFFLFAREPVYSEKEGCYIGRERKRGAIEALVGLLGGTAEELVSLGTVPAPKDVKYLICLDSDTRLNSCSAVEMIGSMLHPLNRAVIGEGGIVISGHGLMQPRVGVELESADLTDFTRIYSGCGGVEPYGALTSNVYYDLFDSGSFTGKGIIDLDAYRSCLLGRFPEGRILSHDLLEGEYLRAGAISDVELSDGCPSSSGAYFRRQHRWIRGDWQLLPWLFGKVPTHGGREKNPLGTLSRWKIFDNLRRSLVHPSVFLTFYLGMLLGGRGARAAVIISAVAWLSSVLINYIPAALHRGLGFGSRRYSNVVDGFGGALMSVFVRFIFLPYSAYISVSAILTALWRQLVTGRHLLEWTTAAASERKNSSLLGTVIAMLPQVIIAVSMIALGEAPITIAVGFVWLSAPLYARSISRRRFRERRMSERDRRFLVECAEGIWRYFDELVTEEDNYLPPDNYQEEPYSGAAHRTSPTNIGLALISGVAAYDIGLIDCGRLEKYAERTLYSVEKLQKWHGQLYNWYDTRSLRPLKPAYVSTVDSGNFLASLIVLREALAEIGCTALAERTERLIAATDLRPLYDTEKQLFRIGIDLERSELSPSCYDLMASEARLTSYLAIALGQAPKKHWRVLSRTLVRSGGSCGMASWTGTMFEYLMPLIFMPCYENTLMWESMCFCVDKQRQAGGSIPWGRSESAYYAFDSALNYRYKANGLQLLAYHRGMDRDTVIAPYASFLALHVWRRTAEENLHELAALGAEGRYGMIEALDFTPNRVRDGNFEPVKCYMAHHLGMSLTSLDNALCGGAIQRRFMRSAQISAWRELLQERVPAKSASAAMPLGHAPEKPQRSTAEIYSASADGCDWQNPSCTLLSNGAYTVVMTETGASRSESLGIRMTAFSPALVSAQTGISFFILENGRMYPLQPAPFFDGDVNYSFEFGGSFARIKAELDGIASEHECTVPDNINGELRTVHIKNTREREFTGELVCFFEPVLTSDARYTAHKSFSKLALYSEKRADLVTFTRRGGDSGKNLSMCFAADRDMSVEFSRESALGRGGLAVLGAGIKTTSSESSGYAIDPCVLACVPFRIQPDETMTVRFSLTVSGERINAEKAAKRLLTLSRNHASSRLDGYALFLGMSSDEVNDAMRLIPHIVLSMDSRLASEPKQELWRYGISGDLPIISLNSADFTDTEPIKRAVRLHSLLWNNGLTFDLVILSDDGGSYQRPVYSSVLSALQCCDAEWLLGAKGGVYLLDMQTEAVVERCSAYMIKPTCDCPPRCTVPPVYPAIVPIAGTGKPVKSEYLFDSDGCFTLHTGGCLPPVMWSQLLANRRFGTDVCESGVNGLWEINAHENRVIPWLNDPLAIQGAECFTLSVNGESMSPFADRDGAECTVSFGFGYASWRKKIGGADVTATMYVPPELPVRMLRLVCDAAAVLEYHADIVLGAEQTASKGIYSSCEDGVISVENLANTDFESSRFLMTADCGFEFTCSELSYRAGKFDGKTGGGLEPCIALRAGFNGSLTLVCGFCSQPELENIVKNYDAELRETREYWDYLTHRFEVGTGVEAIDRYINGWAAYQLIACRLFARTSVYQGGGAFGFRDQLQDVCALMPYLPELAGEYIIYACAHQYTEGDVMHWWHPNGIGAVEKGVRTLCSDDLLWLPYAVCRYVELTGNRELLHRKAPFITSSPFGDGERQRYETPTVSDAAEVFEHCRRAVEMFIGRGVGIHGLPLILGGDWNDGFDRVGAGGKGESLWLAWFGAYVLEHFAALCSENDAAEYLKTAEELRSAAENSWDGSWYRRGYYDDGSPLGSAACDECRIDSIAQSFAVFGGGDRERTGTALRSALNELFDREHGIVRLFTPPFNNNNAPGYIADYAPGVRENGGQYTHAALWLAIACLEYGMSDEGFELLKALMPLSHNGESYMVEPYVIAADVYDAHGHIGRGGWSWYTGSAGWCITAVVEHLLGLKLRGGRLFIEPKLPESVPLCRAVWRTDSAFFNITLRRTGASKLLLDGADTDDSGIPISDMMGEHEIVCEY